jgi:hypothetical protein
MPLTFATGACYGCSTVFSFHPLRVVALLPPCDPQKHRVNEPTCAECKTKTPTQLCLDCVRIVNDKRVAAGIAPVEILPGSYAPCDAAELEC